MLLVELRPLDNEVTLLLVVDRPLETDEDSDDTLLLVELRPDDSEVTLLLVVDRPLETDEDSDETLLLVELKPDDSDVTLRWSWTGRWRWTRTATTHCCWWSSVRTTAK